MERIKKVRRDIAESLSLSVTTFNNIQLSVKTANDQPFFLNIRGDVCADLEVSSALSLAKDVAETIADIYFIGLMMGMMIVAEKHDIYFYQTLGEIEDIVTEHSDRLEEIEFRIGKNEHPYTLFELLLFFEKP